MILERDLLGFYGQQLCEFPYFSQEGHLVLCILLAVPIFMIWASLIPDVVLIRDEKLYQSIYLLLTLVGWFDD